MKIAYMDCFAGICGSMILGSLVDAGLDFNELKQELGKLALDNYEITATKIKKHSISGTLVQVVSGEHHPHRHLHHIAKIINESSLEMHIKEKSLRIFTRLAEAEAKIHDKTIEKIHFHEVGAVDAIVDIVGSVIGFTRLGIEKIYASPIAVGRGFVKCAHGLMPVPAPATAELLHGVPMYTGDIEAELTTPTGAAIISELSSGFGEMPARMRIDTTAYGAGEYELSIPNLLRIYIGEVQSHDERKQNDLYQSEHETGRNNNTSLETDRIAVLQANIDDMNPEFYESIFEVLYQAGALEVYLEQVIMKKNRPGIVICVLAPERLAEDLVQTILLHTSSLGVRRQLMDRRIMKREILSVQTKYGTVHSKVARMKGGEIVQVAPELDDCKRIADERRIPLREIYDEAMATARSEFL